MHRITRFVFWLNGVLVTQDCEHTMLPGMAGILDTLSPCFELALVSSCPSQQLDTIIAKNSLSRWFDAGAVYRLPQHMVSDHEILRYLVKEHVIEPGQSLWIDHDPIRTMLAVREGIDAGIFVDSKRFYRDLGLWGIVPLES